MHYTVPYVWGVRRTVASGSPDSEANSAETATLVASGWVSVCMSNRNSTTGANCTQSTIYIPEAADLLALRLLFPHRRSFTLAKEGGERTAKLGRMSS